MQTEQNVPNWRQIARTLLDRPNDASVECAPCRALLSAYVEAELEGRAAAAEFPEVAQHLPGCVDCQEQYRELFAILQMQKQGLLPTPPLDAQLDFSYLDALYTPPTLWEQVQASGQQVQRLVSEIRLQLGRVTATFEQLPARLSPQPMPAAMRQKGPASGQGAQLLSVPTNEADVVLGLIIGPVAQQDTTIGVQVTTASDGQPLERVRVTVRDQERRLLASELTAETGRVFFDHIGPGSYLIQIRYQERIWELPLAFVADAAIRD